MKLTEEIDAMRTIGISPIEVLVIPRILAATFMMVLLGFLCLGGGDCRRGGGRRPHARHPRSGPFFDRIHDVVPEHDLWVGLIKAPVFGLIVALAGCYNGLQVGAAIPKKSGGARRWRWFRRFLPVIVSRRLFLRCSSPRSGGGDDRTPAFSG